MARYEANYAGTGAWLRSGERLQDVCRRVAHSIAERAQAIAPVETGEYRSMIGVRDARDSDGRVAADVEASAPHSVVVELGSQQTGGRGHHVLLRAAQSV